MNRLGGLERRVGRRRQGGREGERERQTTQDGAGTSLTRAWTPAALPADRPAECVRVRERDADASVQIEPSQAGVSSQPIHRARFTPSGLPAMRSAPSTQPRAFSPEHSVPHSVPITGNKIGGITERGREPRSSSLRKRSLHS